MLVNHFPSSLQLRISLVQLVLFYLPFFLFCSQDFNVFSYFSHNLQSQLSFCASSCYITRPIHPSFYLHSPIFKQQPSPSLPTPPPSLIITSSFSPLHPPLPSYRNLLAVTFNLPPQPFLVIRDNVECSSVFAANLYSDLATQFFFRRFTPWILVFFLPGATTLW